MNECDNDVRGIYRKLAIPFWVLLFLSVLTIFGLIFSAAQGQNRKAVETSVQLAQSAIATTQKTLSILTLEYGYWDQAVDNLVTNLDLDWADENISSLAATYGISSSYVLGIDNRLVFSSINGKPSEDDPLARFGESIKPLLTKVRSGPHAGSPKPAEGLVKDADSIYLASVVLLTTYDSVVDIPTQSVLIFTRKLDNNLLNEIEKSYQLPNLKVTHSSKTDTIASFPLFASDKSPIGRLAWEPDLPGTKVASFLVYGISAMFILMVAIILVFLRRIREISDNTALKSELLKSTLDSVNQGIASWDMNDRLLAWNSKCEEFWYFPPMVQVGMSKKELLEHIGSMGGLGSGDLIEVADQRYQEIKLAGANSSEKFSLHDGRHISLYRYPMPNGGHTTVYTDITERLAYENKLKSSKETAEKENRDKSTFIANMNHELRTPLNAIIGFSDMMISQVFGKLGSQKYAEYATDINTAGRHLLGQINMVLDMSKLRRGKSPQIA